MADVSDHEVLRRHALAVGMGEDLFDRWLVGKNDAFAGDTPSHALAEGRLLEAVEAVDAFCSARPSETPNCTCASHGLAAEYRHGLGCAYGRELRARAQRDRMPTR